MGRTLGHERLLCIGRAPFATREARGERHREGRAAGGRLRVLRFRRAARGPHVLVVPVVDRLYAAQSRLRSAVALATREPVTISANNRLLPP